MDDSHALPSDLPSPDALLRHEEFVRSLARRLAGDASAADDHAQDAWLAALTHAPKHGSLRAWLGRIVRNRAINARRDGSRRAARERFAARDERVEPASASLEALELQHLVVGAVLGLPEPYRALVIAVHFERRKPADLARERRVAPGTVRSQLSRALEMLRETLDRERGSRDAWAGALLAWAGREPAPQAGGGVAGGSGVAAAAAPSHASPVLAAAVAVALVSAGTWAALELGGERDPGAAELVRASEATRPQAGELDAAGGTRSARVEAFVPDPVLVVEPLAARPQVDPLAGLDATLVRVRQFKRELLERATTPEPEVLAEYGWLLERPDAGVVRIADRNRFGFDCDLPWLDGGGAYWSFMRRSHDYQSRPQIGLENGRFRAVFPDITYVHVLKDDAGRDVDLARALRERHHVVRPAGALGAVWPRLWDEPYGRAILGDVDLAMLSNSGFDRDSEVVEGRTYFMRSWLEGEHDFAAVFVVARASGGGATLAWALVGQWPVEGERETPYRSSERPEDLPPAPDLDAFDEPELVAELEGLRASGTQLLFDSFPPELEARAAELAGDRKRGLVRVVDRQTPWTEFSKVREGGAFFSFATWSHDYDREPNLYLEQGYFLATGPGELASWMIDVGEVELADVERCELSAGARELLWNRDLDLHGPVPRREGPGAGLRVLQPAVAGHTYLLRSSHVGGSDLLVAFRCAALDRYGAILEWRVLFQQPR